MKLNRTEAARKLGISLSTFDRKVKSGEIAVVKGEANKFGRATLWVEFPDPEPEPEPVAAPEPAVEVVAAPQPEPEPVKMPPPAPKRELSDTEKRDIEDTEFAALYKAGLATDSAGNTINQTNDRFPSKGLQSLLGPVEEQPKHKPSGVSHMDPALVCNPEVPHNSVDSDDLAELWHPGHKARKEAMYRDARIPQPSEQQNKQHVDRQAIMLAFRQGYSR